jgi:hypothetical protein
VSARYGNRYRRSGSAGSRWMQLRYAGTCKVCGKPIARGETAYWDASTRTATCYDLSCAEADGLTTRECHGPAGWVTERLSQRIGAPAPSIVTTWFNSGASTYRNARGRCEDAPCCGCCD